MSPKGKPKPGARGPRPHLWKSGKFDEYKHNMYVPWMKSKAQANFRNEEWNLSFNDFFNIWNGKWHERGRKGHNLCLARVDSNKPWQSDNIALMTIKEHRAKQGEETIIRRRLSGNYPKYQSTRARDLEKIKYKKMVVI